MSDHDFRCGDLLECVQPYYSQQLNISGQYGIVMGTKPHHIRLWYEQQKRSFWLTYDILKRIETEPTPLLHRIRTLVYGVDAEEWELEETPDLYKLISYTHEASLETLQELRSYLDIDYHSLVLYPEGMGRMIIQFEWNK